MLIQLHWINRTKLTFLLSLSENSIVVDFVFLHITKNSEISLEVVDYTLQYFIRELFTNDLFIPILSFKEKTWSHVILILVPHFNNSSFKPTYIFT